MGLGMHWIGAALLVSAAAPLAAQGDAAARAAATERQMTDDERITLTLGHLASAIPGRDPPPPGARPGAGFIPGIERLGVDLPKVGLAVSLHAADDELRDELVPPNRLYPLAELEAAIAVWRDRTRRRPTIEWAMIDGVNDADEQAGKLAAIAYRLRAHVNLIPLNPTPGWPSRPSSQRRIVSFVRVLEAGGVNVTVRDTRGRRIDAACGQLRLEHTADVRTSGSGRRNSGEETRRRQG